MKIVVVGAGYVGMSIATLLSQHNDVIVIDVDEEKLKKINNKISPIEDDYIEKFLKSKKLNIKTSLDYEKSLKDANYVIICTPTNYDENKMRFNTSSIESVIERIISTKQKVNIVIKSTIPIGYISYLEQKYNIKLIFSPEFLREGKALYDNLYPSRIIVSPKNSVAEEFAKLLKENALKEEIPILLMDPDEAASVKLFSNAYLAMRVAFFNELDTFAEENLLNAKNIIDGVCLDDRIGIFYNNPSFGYGGYCLPKDTKQLLYNYQNIPQNLIYSIINSNDTRKEYIVSKILEKNPKTIGVYRLTMKVNSTNFRNSAVLDIIEKLNKYNIKIYVYEPLFNNESSFDCFELITDVDEFKSKCDLIICNRVDKELYDVIDKVYSRDVYNKD